MRGHLPLAEKMKGIANPCILRKFSLFLNACELQMAQIWCHWKEDGISYKFFFKEFWKWTKFHMTILI
jgi:hypothetical protein